MGYIRMMRAGAMNFTANAIKFVPDLKNILPFEEMIAPEGLAAETTAAAKYVTSAVFIFHLIPHSRTL